MPFDKFEPNMLYNDEKTNDRQAQGKNKKSLLAVDDYPVGLMIYIYKHLSDFIGKIPKLKQAKSVQKEKYNESQLLIHFDYSTCYLPKG